MKKIPTLFVRDPNGRRYVTPEVTPGCEWVLAGEGIATRKYDGTCILLRADYDHGIGRIRGFARREVKPGKTAPPNFEPAETDPATGKSVGWEPIEQSGFHKPYLEAIEPIAEFGALLGRMPIEGTYELIGPNVNGNPERAERHRLERHATAEQLAGWDLTYDSLREHLTTWIAGEGVEGIVWHHPDGRMAKIKTKDFRHA